MDSGAIGRYAVNAMFTLLLAGVAAGAVLGLGGYFLIRFLIHHIVILWR